MTVTKPTMPLKPCNCLECGCHYVTDGTDTSRYATFIFCSHICEEEWTIRTARNYAKLGPEACVRLQQVLDIKTRAAKAAGTGTQK